MKKILLFISSLFVFFTGCAQKDNASSVKEILSHADYNQIFDNKIVEGIEVEELNIGMVNFETGKVIVCDPLVYTDTEPLDRTIPIGKYPLKIYVAKTPDGGERYAIAKLEITDQKAEKWVLALREGEEKYETLEQGEYYGFGVDAGVAGIFDEKAAEAFQKFEKDLLRKNPGFNIYDDFFAAEFKKSAKDQNDPEDIGDWVNYKLPGTNHNITMFHSGWGDGVYPVYYGIDKNGNLASIVIDFFVLLNPEE
jgi:hypothetical protein